MSHVLRRRPLSRRTFLRGLLGGAAVAIAMPPLNAFFDANGVAYAAGDGFPLRFGTFFWGNGVLPERWVPSSTGTDFELSEQLAPLASVKDRLTVISGMEVKTGNPTAHISGPAGLFTGQGLQITGSDETFAGPSLDQILAREIGGDTVFRSLEVGVQPGVRSLSYNGPNQPNPAIADPAALFERLFGPSFREPGEEGVVDPTLALRRSVLDVVMDDATRLRDRVGVEDQQRIEQHLDAVRDLELRIARLEEDPPELAACSRPEAPPALPDVEGRPQMSERSRLVTDLVTMAYACDLTRVLSYWYTHPVSDVLFPEATAGHHQLTHDEPGDQPQVHAIVTSIMRDLNYMLSSMAAIPEGDGTLLDNSAILATTDVSYGRTHQIDEYPILIAGSAGGRLRTGLHYRSTSNENTSLVPFTLLNALGVPVSEFGVDAGRVTNGLGAIEA